MGVLYDEVYISTMREIKVCENTTKKLEKNLDEMERRYSMKTEEFLKRFGQGSIESNKDFVLWHGMYESLLLEEKRMAEFKEIMQYKKC